MRKCFARVTRFPAATETDRTGKKSGHVCLCCIQFVANGECLKIGGDMKLKTKLKAGEGLGDVVGRIAEVTGMKKVAEAYEKCTGKSCGCDQRRKLLNNAVSHVPMT